MSEAAWDKAFNQGSKAMQDRLRKVHAKNPKFQSWLQKSGHAVGASVKQASKEVKPSARVKSLQVKSLKAYGATKGVKVGGEHGSDEMKDTIAPLTRDQHSKVQAAQRAAKAATKAAEPKKAKVKKPLSQAERIAAITKAAAKAKSKSRFDVPTVDPDDVDHDDLIDVHQSLHVRKGYNEEMNIEEGVATAQKVMDRANVVAKTNPDPKKRFAASGLAQKAMLRTINPTGVNTGIVRGGGNKTYRMITGKAPPYQLKPKTGVSEETGMNEGKMKDIVTDREETARLAAQKEPPFTPDKNKIRRGSGGPMSQAKWLAKQAMMKRMKSMKDVKEEVVTEQDDTMEKKEMAQTQLHFMHYAAKEILDFIEMGGEIEEWYQNKLSKVHSDVEGLHSYVEGEKRRMGMVEEVDTGEADARKTTPSSKEKQEKVFAKHKERMKELAKEETEIETDQETSEPIDEKYMGFKKLAASIKAKGGARDPEAVAAAIGRKKYGKEKLQAAAAAGKKMSEAALDPVGKEDKDIDNDGDSDKTDVYLSKRRKAIGSAIRKKVADKMGK